MLWIRRVWWLICLRTIHHQGSHNRFYFQLGNNYIHTCLILSTCLFPVLCVPKYVLNFATSAQYLCLLSYTTILLIVLEKYPLTQMWVPTLHIYMCMTRSTGPPFILQKTNSAGEEVSPLNLCNMFYINLTLFFSQGHCQNI